MDASLNADLDAMLADAPNSVAIVFGSSRSCGLLTITDGERMQGQAARTLGRNIAVDFRPGTVPGLTVGSAVTVDGTQYHVRDLCPADNGLLTRAVCSR